MCCVIRGRDFLAWSSVLIGRATMANTPAFPNLWYICSRVSYKIPSTASFCLIESDMTACPSGWHICRYVCALACLLSRNFISKYACSVVTAWPRPTTCSVVIARSDANKILIKALTSSIASCALKSSLNRCRYNVVKLFFLQSARTL